MMQGQNLSGGGLFILAVYAVEVNVDVVKVENGEGCLNRVSFSNRFMISTQCCGYL